jgi:pimeloyl-ACP methyl ester carboxylesterase
MAKEFILNRKNLKIYVLIEQSKAPRGLVFIMHGLGGYKEQPQIQAFTDVFREYGFTVVRFDTTNSIGESDGKFEDATTTNYYEDLEDVITWSHNQPWYKEPFVLIGHSIGGYSVALYTEINPEKVVAVAPIAPVVSGRLRMSAFERYEPEMLKNWQATGWWIRSSASRPGITFKLPWTFITNSMTDDLLPLAQRLTMPFLTIVGEHDTLAPPEYVSELFSAVLGPKELHIIKDAPHNFREKRHLNEIKAIIGKWIEKYLVK